MNRLEEITNLKQNVTRLIKAIAVLEILANTIEDSEIELKEKMNVSAMTVGVVHASQDLSGQANRTLETYRSSLDYFQKRIKLLQKLDREERFPSIVKEALKLEKASSDSSKAQNELKSSSEAQNRASIESFFKLGKSKILDIRFESGKAKNSFKVFVSSNYLGTIRKTRIKYHSDTAKVFTKQALESRTFVVDGELQVEDKALFSNSKFSVWKFGKDNEQTFPTWQEAAQALVKAKGENKL